jgi:PE family
MLPLVPLTTLDSTESVKCTPLRRRSLLGSCQIYESSDDRRNLVEETKMSFVVAVPDLVQGAAQDLSGLQESLAEAAATVVGPTTGVAPAAADEVSAAVAAIFGNFGQDFQAISAQAQAFHGQFVNLMNAGAGAYISTEIANAQQAVTNAVGAPAQALFGGGASLGSGGGAVAAASTDLLGGLLGSGGTTGGSLVGSLTGGGTGLLGGLTGSSTGVGGVLGGLGSLGGSLTPILSTLPGLSSSLLPGLTGLGAGGGGVGNVFGPYELLFANTFANLQSLGANWLADPFPFLRQVIANQIGYGELVVKASEAFAGGDFAGGLGDLTAIPAAISNNVTNVSHTLTDTSVSVGITPDVSSLPLSLLNSKFSLNLGLPLALGLDAIGAPVTTYNAFVESAAAFDGAVLAGNPVAAFTALVDAPAVIANGFLNGHATLGISLPLSVDLLGIPVSAPVTVGVPLGGVLTPLAPVGALVGPITIGPVKLNPLLPPITVTLPAIPITLGGTPIGGITPGLLTYAPEQLAQAIGAPAPPPPTITVPVPLSTILNLL